MKFVSEASLSTHFPHSCGTYPSINDMIIRGLVPHSGPTLTFKISYSNPRGASGGIAFRNLAIYFSKSDNTGVKWLQMHSMLLKSAGSPLFAASCNPSQYPQGGNCFTCHPSCWTYFGPSEYECIGCQLPRRFNGEVYVNCDPSCSRCHDSNLQSCTACSTSKFLINGRCIDCAPPLFKFTSGNYANSESFRYCFSPCSPDSFVYHDGSCNTVCDEDKFTVTIIADVKFCESACWATILKLPQKTCIGSSSNCLHLFHEVYRAKVPLHFYFKAFY